VFAQICFCFRRIPFGLHLCTIVHRAKSGPP
jgi:hypothetical protein